METSPATWLSDEMGMEEYSAFGHDRYDTNPLDYSIDEFNFQTSPSKCFSMNDQTFNHQTPQNFTCASSISSQVSIDQRPAKQPKLTSQQASPSSSSHIISFDNSSSSPATSLQFFGSTNYEDGATYFRKASTKKIAATSKSPSHAIEERNRREKLSQRFIALSAVVPGLKKTDKASVLGDAIKYLKYLQERVKTLEEQAAKKTMESVVLVKKSLVCFADDSSSSTDENSAGGCRDYPLPEIEITVSDEDVLIRILCENQKGCLMKILTEMEKLHLKVINSVAMPFGNYTLDVTIVAQMDVDFSMTLKDLVKNLRRALLQG